MARPRRTIPTTLISGQEPSFVVSQHEWKRIEGVYAPLAGDLRAQIEQATFAYICFEPFEREAVSAAAVINRLEAMDLAARDLFLLLSSGNSGDGVYTDAIVDWRLAAQNQSLHHISNALLSLAAACRDAKREIGSSPSAYKDGAGWDRWIRTLTTMLRANRLPTGAAKGSDKGEKTSPFVRLVQELQKLMPAPARRHHLGADTSLAKAIHEARRRDK